MRQEMLQHGIHLIGTTRYCKYDPLMTGLVLGLLAILFIGMIACVICPDPWITGILTGVCIVLLFIGPYGAKTGFLEDEYREYETYVDEDCDWDYLTNRFDVLEHVEHIYKLRDKGVTDSSGYIRHVGDD